MSVSSSYIKWKTTLQTTPIILTGGLATAQGGGIPIVSLTNPDVAGIGSDTLGDDIDITTVSGDNITAQGDGYNAGFFSLPGCTLIDFQIAMYPFANQAVAANALIAQPLRVSVLMTIPATSVFPYSIKQSTLIALQNTLQQHALLGGLYTVITPAYIFTNCILQTLKDASSGDPKHVQEIFQFDFSQPLVSQQAAVQAQNNLMQTITNGTPPTGGVPTWASGLPTNNPASTLNSSLASPLIQ